MNKGRLFHVMIIAVVAVAAACTLTKQKTPALSGPSELALSFSIIATPDTLSQDGASQSQIRVKAFDENGQPAGNVLFRAEITVDGSVVDFGTLSARTRTTGSDGQTALTYTAPPAPLVTPTDGSGQFVGIRVTPINGSTDGNSSTNGDAANATSRVVSIHLVPPGVILGPGPTPAFTVSPASPAAFAQVTFDGSTSTAPAGASIFSYSWNFGDGSTAVGNPAFHRFSSAGIFTVSLTVMDSRGFSGTGSKPVTVTPGTLPVASFTVTPASPAANQPASFNGSASTPGAGNTIISYNWDFGSGAGQSTSSPFVTKTYDTPGTYFVTLTVTNDVGQTSNPTQSQVTVTGPPPSATVTARFTINPNPAAVNQAITFDGSPSTATAPQTIQQYQWNFNDGTPLVSTTAPQTSILHSFSTAGVKSVTLTAVDTQGNSNNVTHTVTVQ